LIVFTVCLVALQVSFKTYDDQLYSEAAQFLNLSTSGIESDLKRIEKLTYNIISDSKVQE
jgi:two-component system sensor histidine kinase YesM